jgi:hypothetical protein
MILHKINNIYSLMDNDKMIASSDLDFQIDYEIKALSKENCDHIFGVVDVDVFIDEMLVNRGEHISRVRNKIYGEERDLGRECFNKAMELNKDKLFTVEDVKKAFNAGWVQRHNEEGSHYKNMEILIQSLQQPTEIEVEIEMEDIIQLKKRAGGLTNMGKPKLDNNGCLILKRI